MSCGPQDSDAPQDVWTALRSHANHSAVPLMTHMDLTYRCDLACVHCYLEEREKYELTAAEITRVLDQIADLGGLFMMFSGGDIFLRPDALEILRASCERGFHTSMITHAGHITEPIADAMAEMGVALVRVSVYSSQPPVHDRITRLAGSFHASMRAIALLRERGIAVEMKCPVFEDNPGAELEIPLLAARYDCTYQLDHRIVPAMGALPPHALEGHCQTLTRLNLGVDQKIDVVRAAYGPGANLQSIDRWGPDTFVCNAGRSAVYIDPEGNLFPCIAWEEPAGNVRDTPFATLWTGGDIFQRARQTVRGSFFSCQDCESQSFCEICPGKAHKETGHALNPSAQMCRATTVTRLALEHDRDDLSFDIAPLLAAGAA